MERLEQSRSELPKLREEWAKEYPAYQHWRNETARVDELLEGEFEVANEARLTNPDFQVE